MTALQSQVALTEAGACLAALKRARVQPLPPSAGGEEGVAADDGGVREAALTTEQLQRRAAEVRGGLAYRRQTWVH
jgi:hypothetical protein